MLLQAKATTYGTDSLAFRGSILWNSLPSSAKVHNPLLNSNDKKVEGRKLQMQKLFVNQLGGSLYKHYSEVRFYFLCFFLSATVNCLFCK